MPLSFSMVQYRKKLTESALKTKHSLCNNYKAHVIKFVNSQSMFEINLAQTKLSNRYDIKPKFKTVVYEQ